MKMSRLFKHTLLMTVALFGIIAFSTSLLSAWLLHKHLTAEYISKGRAIASSIASTSVEILLNRDISTFQAMIDQYLDIEGVAYVFMVDDEGVIAAHTFVPSVPQSLRRLKTTQGTVTRRVDITGFGSVIDISQPILAGEAGWVHVGMDRELIQNYIMHATFKGQGLLAVILALSIGVAYVMVNRISRPLNELMEYSSKLAARDFSAKVEIRSRDEIGMLAGTMQTMAHDLSVLIDGLEESVDRATTEHMDTLAHFRTIIDNLADGLLVTDNNGRITHYNPALLEMYGYGSNAPDLSGRDISFLSPRGLEELAEGVVGGDAGAQVAEVLLSSGRTGKAVATAIHKHHGGKGEGLGVVFLIRDITSEKEVDRMKTEFISMVSHELRTPLTSIMGFAKIVRKKLEKVIKPHLNMGAPKVRRSSEQIMGNMDIIISESLRLTELVNDTLDISKMDDGKVEWKMVENDLRGIFEQSLASSVTLFTEKRLEWSMYVPDDLPKVVVDWDRMIQVMVNLISNAVKFTDKGGIKLLAERRNSEVLVSVRDTGCGIPREEHKRIFERFKQVGDTLTDKPKGTGLGLPICKHIVEMHGGSIWVESMPGKGSSFFFSLPLRPREKPADH